MAGGLGKSKLTVRATAPTSSPTRAQVRAREPRYAYVNMSRPALSFSAGAAAPAPRNLGCVLRTCLDCPDPDPKRGQSPSLLTVHVAGTGATWKLLHVQTNTVTRYATCTTVHRYLLATAEHTCQTVTTGRVLCYARVTYNRPGGHLQRHARSTVTEARFSPPLGGQLSASPKMTGARDGWAV